MYKRFQMWLRFFFGFSRTEANGFVVLSLLIILFLILPLFTKHYFTSTHSTAMNSNESRLLDSLLVAMEEAVYEEEEVKDLPLIDINNVSADTLAKYGIPLFLAQRIVKYREQVKPFYEKSDLLKIYGLDSTLYNRIAAAIIEIPERNKEQKQDDVVHQNYKVSDKRSSRDSPSKYVWKLAAFDINKADTTQLKKAYGIGSTYAKRIVSFREALGGFHHLHQLAEVYGLKSPALDSLMAYTFVGEPSGIKQLSINRLSQSELATHPYISHKRANVIVAYRGQHGNYSKATDLLQIGIFDSIFVEKISPYLHFGK